MEKKVRFSNTLDVKGENECVIEFQAFKSNTNEFIIKELVILDLQYLLV